MQRHFERELDALRDRLLSMGALVEKAMHDSIKSAAECDQDAVKEVLRHGDEINQLHIEIDDRAIKLPALQQPVAIDLRC